MALGLSQINIAGHSMGTFLALDYLQHYPSRVKGLVLLGATHPKTAKTEDEKALWGQQEKEGKAFIERPEVASELHRQGLDKDASLLTPQEATSNWRIHFAAANLNHLDR